MGNGNFMYPRALRQNDVDSGPHSTMGVGFSIALNVTLRRILYLLLCLVIHIDWPHGGVPFLVPFAHLLRISYNEAPKVWLLASTLT